MLDLFLLLAILAVIGTGYFIWRVAAKTSRHVTDTPARRREDARDWQRRFGADSLLSVNFLQPTQNEILETLSVLDHLIPGWETGQPDLIESHFLNELAVSFPSLRKPKCVFPLPFAETLPATNMVGSGRGKRPVTEGEVTGQRESFRVSRAQVNALEQMVAGSVGPAEITPGSLPFRISGEKSAARARNPWPAVFGVAAVLIAAMLGISYVYDKPPVLKKGATGHVTPSISPATVRPEPKDGTPQPAEPVAVASPSPAPALEPETTPSLVAVSTPPPATGLSAEKTALNARIAVSQQRAVGKYPSLAVEGSEINLRFVFRYKNLVHENSPRLLDPNWPEQLAEECAAAAVASKRSALTQVNAARH